MLGCDIVSPGHLCGNAGSAVAGVTNSELHLCSNTIERLDYADLTRCAFFEKGFILRMSTPKRSILWYRGHSHIL